MTNGNDPAFSKAAFYHPDGGADSPQEGLSKREYFAAINTDPIPDSFVMIYVRNKEKESKGYTRTDGKYWDTLNPYEKAEVRALWRVQSADALIKALNETENKG